MHDARRTAAFSRALRRTSNLKLVTIVGKSLGNLDIDAATASGVTLVHPAEDLNSPQHQRLVPATPELAWGSPFQSLGISRRKT